MTTSERMFLIVLRRKTGESRIEDLGSDLSSAVETFAARERDLADRGDLEVVLIGSPSLEVLRTTHSSYFEDADGLKSILASSGH